MKKRILTIILILSLLFAGCGVSEEVSSSEAYSTGESAVVSDISEDMTSETSPEISEYSEASETASSEPSPEQVKELTDSFAALIEAEREIDEFAIERTPIKDGEAEVYYPDYYPSVNVYSLPDTEKFSTKEKFDSKFKTVFSDWESTETKYLAYPEYGTHAVMIFDGYKVMLSNNYMEGSIYNLEPQNIELISYTEGKAVFSVAETESGTKAEVGMVYTQDGWKLESSVYFALKEACEAEKLAGRWEDNITDGMMNDGSAKRLAGKTLIVNIFINDTKSSWTDDEKASMLEYLGQACEFLTEQAALYGTEASFEYTGVDDSPTLDYGFNVSLSSTIMTEYVYLNQGCIGIDEYMEDLYDKAMYSGYDNVCVLFNVNKADRSFARIRNSDNDTKYYEEPYYESAVLFFSTDKSNINYIKPGTYAHELLHLFGALDLYFPYDINDYRKNLCMTFMPSEIMLTVTENINSIMINRFTAFRVGLFPYLEDQLSVFNILEYIGPES